jgi:hypothetical protein
MSDNRTLRNKKELLFAEEMYSSRVGIFRQRLESGAAEESGPVMLNTDAILGYQRPHVVIQGHRLARLLTLPKRSDEPPPTESRFQALCRLLEEGRPVATCHALQKAAGSERAARYGVLCGCLRFIVPHRPFARLQPSEWHLRTSAMSSVFRRSFVRQLHAPARNASVFDLSHS